MSAVTFPIVARAAGGALIASPSRALREQVLHSLNGRWRPVQHALGGAEALVKLEQRDWQVLFLDRRLEDLNSEELMAIIERRFPGIHVVLVDSDTATPAEEVGKARPDRAGFIRVRTRRRIRIRNRGGRRSGSGRRCVENGGSQRRPKASSI